jgi:hypothetical protein
MGSGYLPGSAQSIFKSLAYLKTKLTGHRRS